MTYAPHRGTVTTAGLNVGLRPVTDSGDAGAESRAAARALLDRLSPAWHAHALCRDRGDINWHDDGAGRDAIAVCASCKVQWDCLDAARATETTISDIHGIRGGLSAPQRRRQFNEGSAA